MWHRPLGAHNDDMDLTRGVSSGLAHPLGAHRGDGGTNFSVWSRTAAQLDLLLFDDVDDSRPSRWIVLDPQQNRTSSYWHVLVPDVEPGQVYTSPSPRDRTRS